MSSLHGERLKGNGNHLINYKVQYELEICGDCEGTGIDPFTGDDCGICQGVGEIGVEKWK